MSWEPRAEGHRSAPSSRHPPTPPASLVARPRLTGLLDRAVALTSVVAPAGSGKTVLAAEWVETRRASGQQVHWVPATDTVALVGALASAAGLSPADAAEVCRSCGDVPGPELADALRSRAEAGAKPGPIVVDDAHQLPPDSVALLGRMLSTAPELVRLVLLSRRDLPLPLVQLDLAGQLVMIRAGQLCFDDDDAAALVRSHAPRATPDDVTQLQEHTRGWAAAMILAARALDAAEDPRTAHLMMRSTEQPVLDYLLTESLDGLSETTRQVLTSLCHETDVTAESAVALSDHPDAGERLTALARDGLLVTAYADRDGGALMWRLHPLLVEALRRQDATDARRSDPEAHLRGAALARAAGQPADAVRHAVLSGDADLLVALLLDLGPELLATGRTDVVDEGLRHLTPTCRASRPELLGVEALCRLQEGDVAEAADVGARAEAALAEAGDSADIRFRADVATIGLWRARLGWTALEDAVSAATLVLDRPATEPLSVARTSAMLLELGATASWRDDLAAAVQHTRDALAMARSLGHDRLAVQALGQCALLAAAQGATQSAREEAEECLRRTAPGDDVARRRAHLALAWAEFQAVDLAQAATDLELSRAPTGPVDPMADVLAAVLHARLLIEEGCLQEAELVLGARLLVLDPQPGFTRAIVGTARAQLAAATGDDDGLDSAIAELAEIGATAEARLFGAIRTAFTGRVMEAVADLDDLARHPSPNLLTRSGVEVVRFTLLMLVGEVEAGRASLPRMLATVATHRHLYVLTAALRAGDAFLELLDHETRRPDAHPYASEAMVAMRSYELAYTDRRRPLLDASRTAAAGAKRRVVTSVRGSSPSSLVVALTPREAEVFEQLALGGSYNDIGQALFVTENTVKTHLASIYRKLGVERRAEALQAGRDLGLLQAVLRRTLQ